MTTFIFVSVDTEEKAVEADRALHDMHRDAIITLYDHAVIVKDVGGRVRVREVQYPHPDATLGGIPGGAFVGLLGGPLGTAIGVGAGALTGGAFDLVRQRLSNDFVADVGAHLAGGKAAVIAEIDEHGRAVFDERMSALGAHVRRYTPTQLEDAYLEGAIDAARQDPATAPEELSRLQELLARQKALHVVPGL